MADSLFSGTVDFAKFAGSRFDERLSRNLIGFARFPDDKN